MNIIKLWVPVIAWGGIIFYLSSLPGLSSGLDYDYLLRKLAHMSEYLILTFLLYRAFKHTFKLNYLSLLFYPSMIAFCYAASDEFHQLSVPHRHGDFKDVLIDSIGIALFYLIHRVFEKKS